MSIGFRPVTSGDQNLLLDLYASARAQELAQVQWSREQKQAFVQMQFLAQVRHYEQHYPASQHLIVLWGEEEAGRLWVDRGPDAIHILDLIIAPSMRGRGIGTAVLRGLLAEGAAARRSVTIYLETWSSAESLFLRLAFAKVAEQGFHHLYRWEPAPAAT